MKQAVIGLVAHVDAGKTTLAEALLFQAGAIRAQGRVDHGDAHMDTDAQERQRGITIFAQQAAFDYAGAHLMLIDAPGHVDFSAEAERTLRALDYAILVVGANDGVQGHTETLWELLCRYQVPTFLFANKMDLAGADRAALLAQLRGRLSGACVDAAALLAATGLAGAARASATGAGDAAGKPEPSHGGAAGASAIAAGAGTAVSEPMSAPRAPAVGGGGAVVLSASAADAAVREPVTATEDAAFAPTPAACAQALEDAASADEAALEEYLDTGSLSAETLRRLVSERFVFPVFFGAALRNEGVGELLDGLAALIAEKTWPDAFAARVYKVSRSPRGERLAHLKVTGGVLRAKMLLAGIDRGAAWEEKVDQVRLYQADSFTTVSEVPAGRICTVTGLSHVHPGSALGAEPTGPQPVLAPVLSYQVLPEEGTDMHALVRALRELADEDPLLAVSWHEQLQEAHVQLMGSVQREVVQQLLRDRYGMEVSFGPGGILYRETVTAPVEGVGHFEPLRHYAEVHVLLEPLPRGAGMRFGTRCAEDDLDRNWQRLVLTHCMEREHVGVLAGAPLTDVRVTLLAGRAHAKHTEGGDFRQATYRAIRQGLMEARERGACLLLEPWYRLRLSVPADKVGRALADLARMDAEFEAPEVAGDMAELAGCVPASEVGEYALEVSGYTGGRGRLALEYDGYRACHNADEVIARAAYDPEADLPNTPDSVFCSHGAGYTVKWREVPAHAHVTVDPARLRPWREADASFFAKQ